jgi:hypothetical protein
LTTLTNGVLSVVAATAALIMRGVGASAAELPPYEVFDFPIAPHQLVTLG